MAYPNRTDLQNPAKKVARQAAKGQQYGKATAQLQAQKAVPIGRAPSESVPPPQPQQGPMPGSLGAFTRQTERPNEPLTAGVNFGPGPNAAQAGVAQPIRTDDPVLERLRTLYAQYPNSDLADLLDSYTKDGY